MGFYDEIAKDINWEIGTGTESYLKVVNGKLQLPNPKWLQYHLPYLDKVIEAIHAFRENKLYGMSYDTNKIIKHVIDDPEEALCFLKDIDSKYNEFSIDIESSNLTTNKETNSILCIGLAYKDNEGVSFLKPCFKSQKFVEYFRLFALKNENRFIFHNGLFDKSRTKIIEDIDLKIDDDTMLMHYCGINEHKGTHGLKDLAQLYLGFPEWDKSLDDQKLKLCKLHKAKVKDFQYDWYDQIELAEYNVIDCVATFQLKKLFTKLMRPESFHIYRKLVEASKYYSNMISRGMLLNEEYWHKLRDDLENQKSELEKALSILMPGVLPTSPKQVSEWLKITFPFDYVESADKYTIENLLIKYPDNEALTKLLEYRKVVKYLKTYVYGLWDRKDYQNVIHCEFKLHGTETGRLSCTNPNMQNIPRNSSIKSLFIAHPGYKLIQLDYSQAELRVLAYISNDPYLIECYVEGRDLHTEMQKQLFKDNFDPHDKDQRMIAKTVNFGIPYGRTAAGMAQKLRISLSDAKKYLQNWFDGATKVKDYIKKCHDMALAEPQQLYFTPFGRTRHYFITSDLVNHTMNQAVNFPISSTANDLTIHSLVEIGKWLEEKQYDAYLVNTVHDSIVIEVREKDAKEIAEHCQLIMSSIPKKYLPNCTVPFRADVDYGVCYGDMNEPDWGDEDGDE